jgi:hypothetical protein
MHGPSTAQDHHASDGGSESECAYEGLGKEEVEAASSLATFILAASHAGRPKSAKLKQPLSAPAVLTSTKTEDDGGDDGSEDPSLSDPLWHKKQRR